MGKSFKQSFEKYTAQLKLFVEEKFYSKKADVAIFAQRLQKYEESQTGLDHEYSQEINLH